VDRTEARLKEPETAKLPRRTLTPIPGSIATARTALQEARAALEKEEYARVREAAMAIARDFKVTLDQLTPEPATPARKGKR
jgi:hypothetical protein